ncbi:MAG: glycosyltransferase family 4 protein [Chloroflexota bacterium]|nr:glycosyltransferase family 4 protein [Chloroflexota bacterium]
MTPLRIFTWHVHGSYLLYLVQSPHEFFVPVKPGRPNPYGGRGEPGGPFPWPDNLHEVPADRVREQRFDCILFQRRDQYTSDQYEILSPEQRRLPKIFLEHDPPRESPTDTKHVVDDPNVLLVHVTHFNDLMWDSGRTPTRVIEHGVFAPEDVRYTGELERGIVVINHLARRGRRLGLDVFERARARVPLDLVGMGAEEAGGLGEVQHDDLPGFAARYRFFFNPIRYTSLGLAVCEAMMLGMPIVGLATTEMAATIENGVSGYVDTDVERLIERMHELLADPGEARRLGTGARRAARERFDIRRFADDWDRAFRLVMASPARAARRGGLGGNGSTARAWVSA